MQNNSLPVIRCFFRFVLAFGASFLFSGGVSRADEPLLLDKPGAATAKAEPQILTIGSKAPELDIEFWISDRDGTLPHVTSFEKGKVYVVEFWATWCGPCIGVMPHLAESQAKHIEDGVQFISVTIEDMETIEKFLPQEYPGGEGITFAELTNAYCLTADPDESVFRDYMEASGLSGIPKAFVVGKTGEIEWIGHPTAIDEPLEQILADKWDREPLRKRLKVTREHQQKLPEVIGLIRVGDVDGALAMTNEMVAVEKAADAISPKTLRLRMIIAMEKGGKVAVEALKDTGKLFADKPIQLIRLAQSVAGDADPELLKAASDLTKRAVEKSRGGDNPTLIGASLASHASLLHQCGKLDEAITAQKEAVELIEDESLQEFLAQLLKEKSDLEKPESVNEKPELDPSED